MSNEKAGSGRLIPLPTSSDLLATERTVLREDAVSVVYVYVSNQNLIDIKLWCLFVYYDLVLVLLFRGAMHTTSTAFR